MMKSLKIAGGGAGAGCSRTSPLPVSGARALYFGSSARSSSSSSIARRAQRIGSSSSNGSTNSTTSNSSSNNNGADSARIASLLERAAGLSPADAARAADALAADGGVAFGAWPGGPCEGDCKARLGCALDQLADSLVSSQFTTPHPNPNSANSVDPRCKLGKITLGSMQTRQTQTNPKK